MSENLQTQATEPTAPPPPADTELRFTAEQRQAFKRGETPAIEVAETRPADRAADPIDARAANKDIEAPANEVDPDLVTVDDKGVARAKDGRFVKSVPYERLSKEVARRKAAEDQLLAARETVARADERLKMATETTERRVEEKKPEAAPPDPEVDILAYAKWQAEQIKQLQEQVKTSSTATSERLAETDRQRTYESDVQRVKNAKPEEGGRPDYADAYRHLMVARARQLMLSNPAAFSTASGEPNIPAIKSQLSEDERAIRDSALAAKRSPAEMIYQNAVLFGYTQREPAKNDPQTPDKSAALAEIEAINKGASASQTMRGVGTAGGVGGDQLTKSKLASMTETQYGEARKAYIAKHGRAAWMSLVG